MNLLAYIQSWLQKLLASFFFILSYIYFLDMFFYALQYKDGQKISQSMANHLSIEFYLSLSGLLVC